MRTIQREDQRIGSPGSRQNMSKADWHWGHSGQRRRTPDERSVSEQGRDSQKRQTEEERKKRRTFIMSSTGRMKVLESACLLGGDHGIVDIPIDHPSGSKQHAVFQYRLMEDTNAEGTFGPRVKPSITGLSPGNGTFLNKCFEPQRYYELKEKDGH
ncbi:hypothetical protein STEG23_014515 [Scotinomys teguina]